MSQFLILLSLTILLALAFLIFLILGITKKKSKWFITSGICLVLAFFTGFFMLFSVLLKTQDKIITAMRPRTGQSIYNALFGVPAKPCVQVKRYKDQVVPRLDCCIWLEFNTCPEELQRIIKQQSYQNQQHAAADSSSYLPSYSDRPVWWEPWDLGEKLNSLQHIDPADPNHAQYLLFSIDSTRGYYCDMAE